MAHDHFLELPKSVWGLKIAQLVLSVIVLGLSAFNAYVYPWDADCLAVFTASFSMLILIYYSVAMHGAPKLYNWVALIVLESLAVVFWLSTWATLAALYAYLTTPAYYSPYDDFTKRFAKRDIYTVVTAYTGPSIAALALSVINFILYCVTLGFMAMASHRQRKNGRPMNPTSNATLPYFGTQNEVKTDAAPAPAYAHDAPVPQQAPGQTYYPPAQAQAQPQHVAPSPVSPDPAQVPQARGPGAHEVQGSSTYR